MVYIWNPNKKQSTRKPDRTFDFWSFSSIQFSLIPAGSLFLAPQGPSDEYYAFSVKSLTTEMIFFQQLMQANNKENTNSPHYWPFVGIHYLNRYP